MRVSFVTVGVVEGVVLILLFRNGVLVISEFAGAAQYLGAGSVSFRLYSI